MRASHLAVLNRKDITIMLLVRVEGDKIVGWRLGKRLIINCQAYIPS